MFRTISPIIAAMILTLCISSCSGNHRVDNPNEISVSVGPAIGQAAGEKAALPKARIYRMNGDFAKLVPVTLSADGKSVANFPAPSDLKEAQPIDLGDGWWLDRRGIGPNSAFTIYSYENYSKMASAPTTAQLLNSLNRGARITRIVDMPFPYSSGCEEKCKEEIANGLKNSTVIL